MTNPVSDPGQVPADEIPAAQALASAAELPTGTPGLGAAPADQAGAAPAAAPPQVDRKGNHHDPAVHENPPRLNCEGCWAKKRGNAARKTKGLPFSGSGSLAGRQAKPADPPPAGDQNRQPPPDDDGQLEAVSFLAPPPAAGGTVIAAEVMPEALRTPEDYAGTAAGLVLALFGLCRILMGKAWKPDGEESKAWNDAMRRTLAHYQAPVLGPVVELIPLAITTAAKRADDQETRAKVGGFLAWLRGVFGRRQVRQQQQVDQQAAPAAAPPPMAMMAGASPRVEY